MDLIKKMWRVLKNIIKILLIILYLIVLIHILEGLLRGTRIMYKEISFLTDKLPEDEQEYTIAFLTDVHNYPLEKLKIIVENINKKQPDILLLGGDFSQENGVMSEEIEILKKVNVKDGIYGVAGNHDRWKNLFAEMEKNEMQTLMNEGVEISDWLYLAGTSDYWNAAIRADIGKSILGAKENQFILLLTHNADLTMRQTAKGVDLVLSGHTHGGEVSLFGIWKPALSKVTRYGNKFSGGMVTSRDDVQVYVSRGVSGWLPFRIFAPPEVTYITLSKKDA